MVADSGITDIFIGDGEIKIYFSTKIIANA